MGFNRLLHDYGFGEPADEAHELWRSGDREAADDAITSELVDEFAVYGTPETCGEGLAPYYEAGVDIPILWPPFTASRDSVEDPIDAFTHR